MCCLSAKPNDDTQTRYLYSILAYETGIIPKKAKKKKGRKMKTVSLYKKEANKGRKKDTSIGCH